MKLKLHRLFGQWQAPLVHQWSAALIMTLLPLVGAIFYAMHSINEQNKAQYHLVNSVILVNQLSVKLSEEVHELERFAKQFAVLGDKRFAELYRAKESEVADKLERLAGVIRRPEMESAKVTLSTMISGKQVVAEFALPPVPESGEETGAAEAHRKALEALFDGVNKQVWIIESLTEQYIAQSLASTEESFQERQVRIWLIGSLVLPLSGALLFVFSYRISRPLQKLDHSIRALGQGELEKPVVIPGSGDLVALGERLEWMRCRLLSLEKQKNVFLRHVTHELKTPLSSIIEASSLLADEVPGPINGKQRQVIGILEKNAGKLLAQIQQLLNFNTVRLEAVDGKSEVCLHRLATKLIGHAEDISKDRDIRFQLAGGPFLVNTEPARLEMILANLLTNAVDYSPPGTEITVSWKKSSGLVLISVEDQGPGIDPSDVEQIFRPFYQGKNKKNGAIKGSGLGLSIVKECVEALAGQVEVDSRPGKGAKFTVLLPLYPLAEEDLSA